jgi:hypothetical protein
MISIHTGPTLLSMAHAHRRDDLRLAAEHRAALWLTQPNRPIPRHRPWWWGLARSRTA